MNVCQGFDSASTDTGTGQDGDKEDGDDTDEKDKQQTENRFVLLGGEIAILAYSVILKQQKQAFDSMPFYLFIYHRY